MHPLIGCEVKSGEFIEDGEESINSSGRIDLECVLNLKTRWIIGCGYPG
jgi:hypothetical protein